MGVYIKGMQMPTRCLNCPMYDDFNYLCKLYSFGIPARYNYVGATRPEWCPLVDLGKHGDLIDRQKLIEDNKHLEYPTDGKYRRDRAWAVGFNAGAKHCNEHAVYAKTVIEAEDES